MLTRREVLIAAGAAGIAASSIVMRPLLASASQPSTPVELRRAQRRVRLPHAHLRRSATIPYVPRAACTRLNPLPSSEMRSLHRALHTDRVVIVQPTVYGTDNSCTLDAIKQLGPGARGIAAIDEKTSDADLDRMHQGGHSRYSHQPRNGWPIRSSRGASAPRESDWTRSKTAAIGTSRSTRGLRSSKRSRTKYVASPVPVSFDHFGGAQGGLGCQASQDSKSCCSLLKSGKAYVKVSAPYRSSKLAPGLRGRRTTGESLIAANPQRIIWGTDWPHPRKFPAESPSEITPLYQIDDGRDLNLVALWAPDPAKRKTILVDNPAKLYGF